MICNHRIVHTAIYVMGRARDSVQLLADRVLLSRLVLDKAGTVRLFEIVGQFNKDQQMPTTIGKLTPSTTELEAISRNNTNAPQRILKTQEILSHVQKLACSKQENFSLLMSVKIQHKNVGHFQSTSAHDPF